MVDKSFDGDLLWFERVAMVEHTIRSVESFENQVVDWLNRIDSWNVGACVIVRCVQSLTSHRWNSLMAGIAHLSACTFAATFAIRRWLKWTLAIPILWFPIGGSFLIGTVVLTIIHAVLITILLLLCCWSVLYKWFGILKRTCYFGC